MQEYPEQEDLEQEDLEQEYLEEDSEEAETMRRALFAAAILLAGADGTVSDVEREALTELLGPRGITRNLKPELLRPVLHDRLKALKNKVRYARQVQWMRDLTSVAMADGELCTAERAFLVQVATALEMPTRIIDAAVQRPRDLD